MQSETAAREHGGIISKHYDAAIAQNKADQHLNEPSGEADLETVARGLMVKSGDKTMKPHTWL